MDTPCKSPLTWLIIGSLLLMTGGCVYNSPKPSPAPTPAQTPTPTVATKPAATVSEPKTTTQHTVAATTAHAPATSTVAKPKPVVKPKPRVTKPAARSEPKPTPVKPATKPSTPATKPMEPAPTPVETPQPTLAQAQPVTAPPAPAETVTVALDKLPINIHDQWIVDRNASQCMLKSMPMRMDDGQGGTSVTFLLTPDSLQFNTKSDIDLSYTGTGIQVDDGPAFALETVDNGTNLHISKQRKPLLERMRNGQSVQLTLGFWPTWPVTHTYAVTLPLANFATAMQAWETCNQLLKTP